MKHLQITFLLVIYILSYNILSAQKATEKGTSFRLFWQDIFESYHELFLARDSASYSGFCQQHGLNPANKHNRKTYATIGLLHRMMTSGTSSNCSTAGILGIPYYWHWVDDMPRQSIQWVADGRMLGDVSPPASFRRYRSYADIDRTPDIFWQDCMADEPKFYVDGCDTFYTFGWCSEREMAFLAMLRTAGFFENRNQALQPSGRVAVEGPHSVSALKLRFYADSDQLIWIEAKVDNTYNDITWRSAKNGNLSVNKERYETWYNKQAASASMIDNLRFLQVSAVAAARIRHQLNNYFNLN